MATAGRRRVVDPRRRARGRRGTHRTTAPWGCRRDRPGAGRRLAQSNVLSVGMTANLATRFSTPCTDAGSITLPTVKYLAANPSGVT